MKTLKILDWPKRRFYSETHPFYRWNKLFKESGLKVDVYHHHLDKRLKDADYLLIHSRYFENGWQNLKSRNAQNEEELKSYLIEMKKNAGKLIWFDAADSSGSSDFPIIPYVDVFLKKQVLKDKRYYTEQPLKNDLRIWMNRLKNERPSTPFKPCPTDQLAKIRIGWNIGLNDYRYFGYKMSRLSNYLSYSLYSTSYKEVTKKRIFDLTFRGTLPQVENSINKISFQRNKLLKLLPQLNMQIASGPTISKANYLKELRNSKLSISPYGWGEICYRDFETFISGALLIKPSMEHLITYPNIYRPQETYIPISWDLSDLEEKLDHLNTNYFDYQQIAVNGQDLYKKISNDGDAFVHHVLKSIV